jgi:hypothetical protein
MPAARRRGSIVPRSSCAPNPSITTRTRTPRRAARSSATATAIAAASSWKM